jgi:tRNA (mo5U34)-methyltransferase
MAVMAANLQSEANALGPWFHNLHLPDGTQTCRNHSLGDFPSFKWRQFAHRIPEDLTGMTVLDIGCNAGFYSFELAKRGAQVTGIDSDPHYLRQAHWAAEHFGVAERVQFVQAQVYDLAHWEEQFDIIWFMGVLYHLRYPLLGLDIVARRTRRMLVFQTMSLPEREIVEPPEDLSLDERDSMLQAGWPKMAFIERKLAGDPTNWWALNDAGVEALLRSSGFRVLERPAHEVYLCELHRQPHAEIQELLEAEYAAAIGLHRE